VDHLQQKFRRRNNLYWIVFSLLLFCTIGGLAFITIPYVLAPETTVGHPVIPPAVKPGDTPETTWLDEKTVAPETTVGHPVIPPAVKPGDTPETTWLDEKTVEHLYKWSQIIKAFVATVSPIITGLTLLYLWRYRRRMRLARKMARMRRGLSQD